MNLGEWRHPPDVTGDTFIISTSSSSICMQLTSLLSYSADHTPPWACSPPNSTSPPHPPCHPAPPTWPWWPSPRIALSAVLGSNIDFSWRIWCLKWKVEVGELSLQDSLKHNYTLELFQLTFLLHHSQDSIELYTRSQIPIYSTNFLKTYLDIYSGSVLFVCLSCGLVSARLLIPPAWLPKDWK